MKRLFGRIIVGGSLLLLTIVPLILTASASDSRSAVELEVAVDGRRVSDSSDANPVVLDPSGSPNLHVGVANNAGYPIEVQTVRLEGSVIGLTLFAYDTAVEMHLEPGEKEDRVFPIDLMRLSEQAVGLIPSRVEILDPDHASLGAKTFVANARGSLRSVYGLLGFGIAALTVASLAQAVVKLVLHTLPASRWRRGLRFAMPGVGAGLTAVFTLSTLRIFAPSADKWIPLVAAGALLGFLAGFLTPSPELGEDEWDEAEFEATPAPSSSPASRVILPGDQTYS